MEASASGVVEFVPLRADHIPLMRAWLSSGEAFRWYGVDEPPTEAGMRQKYLIDKPRGGTHSFIMHFDGAPIGHIQIYRAADYPEWCSLVGGRPNDYGLDLFIGEDDLIGRGLGTRVVKAALERLVFARPDAQRCILGPSPDNARAIRCYEKCGFRYERTVTTKGGEQEYVMAIERGA